MQALNGSGEGSLGIISPYRHQVRALKERLERVSASVSAGVRIGESDSETFCLGGEKENQKEKAKAKAKAKEREAPKKGDRGGEGDRRDQSRKNALVQGGGGGGGTGLGPVNGVGTGLGHVGFDVSTVDKFQGRDKDCVILSTVRSAREGEAMNVGDLLRDWRRINVAVTRARKKLIIVGSLDMLQYVPVLRALRDLVQERGWVVDLPPEAFQGQGHGDKM